MIKPSYAELDTRPRALESAFVALQPRVEKIEGAVRT